MKNLKVHIALVVVTLIYAFTFSLVKRVMPEFLGAFGFIVLRAGGAAVLFFLLHSLFVKEKVKDKKDLRRLFISSIFGVSANMLLFFKGLEITTPINGAVLMLCTPIFVVILNSILYKEHLSLIKWIGIFAAATGGLFLVGGSGFQFSTKTLPGDIYITLNAIFYAYYLVYVRKLLEKYKPITVSKWTFLFGGILVMPFGFGEVKSAAFLSMPNEVLLIIAFVIICTTFLTYLLNAWAIGKAGPSIVGSYIYLQPVLATMVAIALGEDYLTISKTMSSMLIFAGVFIVTSKKLSPIKNQQQLNK